MKRRNILHDMDDSALETALKAALYRRDCPNTMELGDYKLGLLADDRRARVHDHVQRCPDCQAELSRLADLLGQADVEVALPESAPAPDPNWRQLMLEHGRAWVDQHTGRLRQLVVSLSSLGSAPAGAPALAGLMGEAETAPRSLPGALYISGADANFEMKIRVTPERAPAELNLCRLELDFNLKDRFGDFSGVQVTLFRDRHAETQVSNAQGEVTFAGLPGGQLASMSLVVILPE